MARIPNCGRCDKQLPNKDGRTKIGNRYYCDECTSIIKREKEEYKALVEQICQYYQLSVPTGLMFKQLKQYKNEAKYTYGGIQYTLWYCKEILNLSFDEKYGLGMVGYKYKEAEDYFLSQQKIQNSVKDHTPIEPNKVTINLSKVYKKDKSNFLFDMNDLLSGGGK